jgi:uncharacterized protein YbjT (DUF2867 family)
MLYFRNILLSMTIMISMVLSVSAYSQQKVLVFGGTGQLGSEIVKTLLAANMDVTVFVRPSSKRALLTGLDLSYISGDVLNEEDVEKALKSARYDVVIDALAKDRADKNAQFYNVSMQYISSWSKVTRVKQIILHGSVGVGLSRPAYPDDRFDTMRAILEAKDSGERHLIESGVNYTIIRNLILLPSDVKESGNAFLTDDQTARGPVTRDALARLSLDCLNNEDCFNEIYHAIDNNIELPEKHSRYKEQLKRFND